MCYYYSEAESTLQYRERVWEELKRQRESEQERVTRDKEKRR